MSPLSSFNFIFHDLKKTVGLVIMMILELTVYFGTLVYENAWESLDTDTDNSQYTVYLIPNKCDETVLESFEKFKGKIEMDERVDYIGFDIISSYSWETIINSVSCDYIKAFSTVESFERYCEKTGISCDTSSLKDGSIIMSRMLAQNNGVKVGDTIDSRVFSDLNRSFTFDLMTEEKGHKAYAIVENADDMLIMIFPSDGKSYDILENITEEYIGDLKNYVSLLPYGISKEINISLDSLNFFAADLVFYSVILSIMINAVFMGAYHPRSFEFALYKAVGIRKRRIVWKIFSEILCMQLLAFISGGIIMFTILYLLNNMVLYPQGKFISYFGQYSAGSLAVVVLLVNVPLLISRVVQVMTVKIRNY